MARQGLLVAYAATFMSLGVIIAADAEAGYRDFPSDSAPFVEAAYGREREHPARHLQSGLATWYGPGFHGRRTASGERFNANAMTAAHRSLPFGTKVRVTNAATGRSVVVRINDRGPFGRGKIIDLSRASAAAIGLGGSDRVVLALL